jgi:hypothetical protein
MIYEVGDDKKVKVLLSESAHGVLMCLLTAEAQGQSSNLRAIDANTIAEMCTKRLVVFCQPTEGNDWGISVSKYARQILAGGHYRLVADNDNQRYQVTRKGYLATLTVKARLG